MPGEICVLCEPDPCLSPPRHHRIYRVQPRLHSGNRGRVYTRTIPGGSQRVGLSRPDFYGLNAHRVNCSDLQIHRFVYRHRCPLNPQRRTLRSYRYRFLDNRGQYRHRYRNRSLISPHYSSSPLLNLPPTAVSAKGAEAMWHESCKMIWRFRDP